MVGMPRAAARVASASLSDQVTLPSAGDQGLQGIHPARQRRRPRRRRRDRRGVRRHRHHFHRRHHPTAVNAVTPASSPGLGIRRRGEGEHLHRLRLRNHRGAELPDRRGQSSTSSSCTAGGAAGAAQARAKRPDRGAHRRGAAHRDPRPHARTAGRAAGGSRERVRQARSCEAVREGRHPCHPRRATNRPGCSTVRSSRVVSGSTSPRWRRACGGAGPDGLAKRRPCSSGATMWAMTNPDNRAERAKEITDTALEKAGEYADGAGGCRGGRKLGREGEGARTRVPRSGGRVGG